MGHRSPVSVDADSTGMRWSALAPAASSPCRCRPWPRRLRAALEDVRPPSRTSRFRGPRQPQPPLLAPPFRRPLDPLSNAREDRGSELGLVNPQNPSKIKDLSGAPDRPVLGDLPSFASPVADREVKGPAGEGSDRAQVGWRRSEVPPSRRPSTRVSEVRSAPLVAQAAKDRQGTNGQRGVLADVQQGADGETKNREFGVGEEARRGAVEDQLEASWLGVYAESGGARRSADSWVQQNLRHRDA